MVDAAKGLAHPARLRLLGMLASGELCVCQLTAVLELAPSTVSQHLSVLARGGLVVDSKEGKLVFYRLGAGELAAAVLPPLLARLAEDAQARADRALVERLRKVPVAALCAADLDLVAIGVRKPAALGPARPVGEDAAR
jgi:DNA-binding transcriptional ArsR family regulator